MLPRNGLLTHAHTHAAQPVPATPAAAAKTHLVQVRARSPLPAVLRVLYGTARLGTARALSYRPAGINATNGQRGGDGGRRGKIIIAIITLGRPSKCPAARRTREMSDSPRAAHNAAVAASVHRMRRRARMTARSGRAQDAHFSREPRFAPEFPAPVPGDVARGKNRRANSVLVDAGAEVVLWLLLSLGHCSELRRCARCSALLCALYATPSTTTTTAAATRKRTTCSGHNNNNVNNINTQY